MEVETFNDWNREHVIFHSFGGDLIDGYVIQKITWPKRPGQNHPHVTVTVETARGEEDFTFLSEGAWLRAVGQQVLFS